MRLIVLKKKEDVERESANFFLKWLKNKNKRVLGLATGETMLGFYRNFSKYLNKSSIELSKVITFNLDEYVGISGKDKRSFRYYMERNFFRKIKLKRSNINFLDGCSDDLNMECRLYEEKIKRAGGIELQLLGIGRNGHIGFNEPGSGIKSSTRVVDLSLNTRKDNSKSFEGFVGFVPKKALTVGIRNILECKEIVLIALGKSKSLAIKEAIEGKVSSKVPASFLQRHKNVTFFLDEAAASGLRKT